MYPAPRFSCRPRRTCGSGAAAQTPSFSTRSVRTDLAELRSWEPRIRQALSTVPQIVDVSTDQQDLGLQTSLVVGPRRRHAPRRESLPARLHAQRLFWPAAGIDHLQIPLNQYHVVMEVAPAYCRIRPS